MHIICNRLVLLFVIGLSSCNSFSTKEPAILSSKTPTQAAQPVSTEQPTSEEPLIPTTLPPATPSPVPEPNDLSTLIQSHAVQNLDQQPEDQLLLEILSFGGGGGGGGLDPCGNNQGGVTISEPIDGTIENGMRILPSFIGGWLQYNPVAFEDRYGFWMGSQFLYDGVICSSEPVDATAQSPGQVLFPARVIYYAEPSSGNDPDRILYIVSLPLEAFSQPGKWHLSINKPQKITLQIIISQPTGPFYLRDDQRFLIGGFSPNEQIVAFGYYIVDLTVRPWQREISSVLFQANDKGYALVELPKLNTEAVFFVGKSGKRAFPDYNWYLFGCPSGSTTTGYGGSCMSEDEFATLLYETYWNK